ncbi:MAG: uracil phosphoribosyltransferase [Saprospiraceae bacterium]|nr:uracil phosphoribosyltransferase [Saprospiraceae bacterium]
MPHVLSETNSIANRFIAELRDVQIQQDSMRFRRNLERIGEIMAYEISKTLDYHEVAVETPLGNTVQMLPQNQVVLAAIMRAGLPMHQGMLNYFDRAANAFISAYRAHNEEGSFEIQLEYVTSPNLDDQVLIISDPMLATGASMERTLNKLKELGNPKVIHVAAIIAARQGVMRLRRLFPQVNIWVGAIDEELTARAYIVPGLGDAGDLAYGLKTDS